jgi:hypothetical protein
VDGLFLQVRVLVPAFGTEEGLWPQRASLTPDLDFLGRLNRDQAQPSLRTFVAGGGLVL